MFVVYKGYPYGGTYPCPDLRSCMCIVSTTAAVVSSPLFAIAIGFVVTIVILLAITVVIRIAITTLIVVFCVYVLFTCVFRCLIGAPESLKARPTLRSKRTTLSPNNSESHCTP